MRRCGRDARDEELELDRMRTGATLAPANDGRTQIRDVGRVQERGDVGSLRIEAPRCRLALASAERLGPDTRATRPLPQRITHVR